MSSQVSHTAEIASLPGIAVRSGELWVPVAGHILDGMEGSLCGVMAVLPVKAREEEAF